MSRFETSIKVICVSALLSIFLIGCGGGRILIKGRVVDDTGAPLKQATVQTQPDTDVVYTQKSGHFLLQQKINALGELEEIPPGQYLLEIILVGYQSLKLRIDPQGGELDLGSLQMQRREAFIGDAAPEESDEPERIQGKGGVKIGN